MQRCEYQFLEYMPVLIKAAEELVQKGFSSIGPSLERSFAHTSSFLYMLKKLTPLLGLISPSARTEFIKMAMSFLYDSRSGELQALSYLLKRAEYFEEGALEKLESTWREIDADKLIAEIEKMAGEKSDSITMWNFFDRDAGLADLVNEISALTTALFAEPVLPKLQKLFAVVKKIPNWVCKSPALEGLFQAMQLLPGKAGEKECNEIFDLVMQIGAKDVKKNQMTPLTFNLFKTVIGATECLCAEKLEVLVHFLMDYQQVGHTVLLCSLADAADQNERLCSVLTAVIAERGETQTLNGRALRINRLSTAERRKLVSDILAYPVIGNDKERVYMLDLLGRRMKHLHPEDHEGVLNAILSLPNELTQIMMLCKVAADINYLAIKNGCELLSVIETNPFPPQTELYDLYEYQQTIMLSVVAGALNKKSAGLSPH
jgi:hypothetical protein